MLKVVHFTTVHDPFDNRIFYRECRTLAAAGYAVVLLAPHDGDQRLDGVEIRALSRPGNRFARMSVGVARAFLKAWRERADVYHFHDPELIPAALLLRLLGKRVVYDVHEDYLTAIQEREYLPSFVRTAVARTFALAEEEASRHFHLILAERYYAERFPRAEAILNYARFPELDEALLAKRPRAANPRLIYTGNVKEYRGAHNHTRLLDRLPDAEVFLVGRCDRDLAADLQQAANDPARLHLEGVGSYVPHQRIVDYYLRETWTAGLALFPPSPHTLRKELTKLFEYMAYGIPVLCSNFPNLREIVESAECGLCIDPADAEAAAEAVRYLHGHPEEAQRMGQNGREAARTTYNWDTQAEKLLAFYGRLF
jgi:glycosyltransferase involved in cell wall biosynthesis